VSAVVSVYTGAEMAVGSVYGNSDRFEVGISVHQGSALGPLLFVTVMEALSGEFGVALPWEFLCMDGLIVVAETEDDLIEGLDGWKDNVESGGMRVSVGGARVVVGGEQQKVARRL